MKSGFCALMVLFLTAHGQAQHDFSDSSDAPVVRPYMMVGEELTYTVHYSFFRIGSVRFRIAAVDTLKSRTVYRAECFIQSAPGLRWLVDLHVIFRSVMDSAIYSHSWTGIDSTEDALTFNSIWFDYDDRRVYYVKRIDTVNGRSSTVKQDTGTARIGAQDGLSIYYFARAFGASTWKTTVPTYVDTIPGPTRLNFTGRLEDAEIDAIDYPIRTRYIDGMAEFVGVFGVTGGFEGWFSDDEARIPVLAKLKVILGSIRLELAEWNRPGWIPPRYEE